jgi:pSer/pThr/pTyr-binding forkhead associated (FHA) protein
MLLHLLQQPTYCRVIFDSDLASQRRSVPLSEGHVFTIGRSPGCDICIGELSIARRQCDIEVRGGAAWLLDYGFTRGERFGRSVSVNGHLVGSVENFWPQRPGIPDGASQHHLDRSNEFMRMQYAKLKWHQLKCGDEISVGTAIFRLIS